jgi:beta-phosphoglucomutase
MVSSRTNGLRNGNLQAVILDMDGVIVDSHPAHLRAWQRFLETLGRKVSKSDLDYILDGRKRTEILHHFFGELSEPEILEYGNRKDRFFQQAAMDVTPVPGVLEFLAELKRRRIALAVATSASATRTRSTLQRLQLSNHFDVVVTGDDIDKGKPDPAIYRLACQRLGVSPESALAFEDAVSGIRAAKGAGVRCIAVSGHEPPNKLCDAGAHHVIENFVGFSLTRLKGILGRNPQHPASLQDLATVAQ